MTYSLDRSDLLQGTTARRAVRDWRRGSHQRAIAMTDNTPSGSLESQLGEALTEAETALDADSDAVDQAALQVIEGRMVRSGCMIGRALYSVDETVPYPGNPWGDAPLGVDSRGTVLASVLEFAGSVNTTTYVASGDSGGLVAVVPDWQIVDADSFWIEESAGERARIRTTEVMGQTLRVPFAGLADNPNTIAGLVALKDEFNSDAVLVSGIDCAPGTLAYRGAQAFSTYPLGTFHGFYEFEYRDKGFWKYRLQRTIYGYQGGADGSLPEGAFRHTLQAIRYINTQAPYANKFPTGSATPTPTEGDGYGPPTTTTSLPNRVTGVYLPFGQNFALQ
ncbi:MAG: hypothetical protein AAGH92_08615 [Planctomycetota bacterium]